MSCPDNNSGGGGCGGGDDDDDDDNDSGSEWTVKSMITGTGEVLLMS